MGTLDEGMSERWCGCWARFVRCPEVTQKKRHLMEGPCWLTDSDAWAWALVAEMDPGKLPVYVGFQHGGFTDEQLGWYLKLQAHPDMVEISRPMAQVLHDHKGRHVTRDLQRIGGDGMFHAADVGEIWRRCGYHPAVVHQPTR